eukprot:scpid21722/ scgid2496/ Regulating synaptic membrane exocytosis protein 1; Rab-3-interacting molecule 1; Rab-3-interacting protein 2
MSSILLNLRQRFANRNRASQDSDQIELSPRPCTDSVSVHTSNSAGSSVTVRAVTSPQKIPTDDDRQNERNRPETSPARTSCVHVHPSSLSLSNTESALGHQEKGDGHEQEDMSEAAVTPSDVVSPGMPAFGSACSSSDLENSARFEERYQPQQLQQHTPTLRTRVMQKRLTRNSQYSPMSSGFGAIDGSDSPGESLDEHDDHEAGEPPSTFSIRDVVGNSSVAAFCGKLIELPKKKLRRRDTGPSACVQQGVACEHGHSCPFAFDIDGVSTEFIDRRRRAIYQKIGMRAEDQLQVFATQGAAFFSDFDVVCDACLQVKQCVEVPGVNRNEKLLICSECMVPLLSGAWYHGMDPLETVNVCTGLIEKAGTPSPGNSSLASPQVNMDDSQFEPEQPMKLLQLAETAPPVDEPIDSETEFEQACDAIAAKRRESMSERHGACSPSLPGECGDAAEDTRSPTESLTASQMEERKDAVSALDIPFPSRRRPSGATDALQLQLKGSPGSPQASSSPATLDSFSESECSDNVSFGTFGGLSDCSAADLAPGLEPNQIAGQEPVGEIELGLQMGVEASKQRSSFVLDILRGHNFKLWQNLDEKPGFEIYIKCYLIFPGRVIKMKTRQVAPGHQPEFLDQLISIMNKKLLQKAERLKIQLWEDHGSLKKKLAVGVATIDLTKIRMEELVMGCYPLYVPHRQTSMPTTPTSPSVSVSPGSTPPSLTRSSSGRFGSLRNSFKRREKLRLRHSTSGTAPSSPLVSANVESSPPAAVLSSSAPTAAPSALSSTPTRGHRSRRESETGETDL